MTSTVFHLVLLLLVGAMSIFTWYGYRHEPSERRTILKWNAVAGVWFSFLFWAGPPAIIESSYDRLGVFVLSLVLAINARRILLGLEFFWVKHSAYSAVMTALKSRRSIGIETTARLGEPPSVFLIPGLRSFFHRRQAEQARALRDKVTADAMLAEAIARRERAWEEAGVLEARRRARPDAWRGALNPKFGRQR